MCQIILFCNKIELRRSDYQSPGFSCTYDFDDLVFFNNKRLMQYFLSSKHILSDFLAAKQRALKNSYTDIFNGLQNIVNFLIN